MELMKVKDWWITARNNVFRFLDTKELIYDISEAQSEGIDLYEFMDRLEDKYPYHDEFSSTLFDCVDQDEFKDYLEKRYNIKLIERTNYYF